MSEHEHHHHHHSGHQHDPGLVAPVPSEDSGSQALAEALRSSFIVVKIVMVLMVVAFFCSGFFTVGPQEKAVILRFGRPVGAGQQALLTSGLHWSLPYPIDEVVKIPITESQHISSDNGWWMTTPEAELSGEELPAGPSLNPAVDGYMITADRNIIHVRATLYYHVEDPLSYVFNFVAASNTLQNALDNAIIYTAAHFKVDDALYNNRSGFQDDVQQCVTELTDAEHLGITITGCIVDDIKPPRQLQSIFDQVTKSREDRNKALNDAYSYTNQVLNQAGAQATTITNEAATASLNYVKSVKADAKRFSGLLAQYRLNPDLFEQQTFLQTMSQVLTNVAEKKFLPTHADGKPVELRLMLNNEPPEPKPEANP